MAREKLRENYRRFFAVLGLDETRAVLSQQTHTANIRTVTAEDAGKGSAPSPGLHRCGCSHHQRPRSAPDGLFRRLRHRAAVRSHSSGHRRRSRRLAGAAPPGIVEKTVAAMGAAYGSRPAELLAALGPCIGPCCFETDGDVPEAMRAALGAIANAYITVKGPKFHVDLAGLNRQWLLRAGLLPERIEVSGICTACRPDLFWSHRKMGDQRGVQVAVISLKEGL